MASRASARLSKGGYLRLSADLIPRDWNSFGKHDFFILIDPKGKKIELQPANGKESPLPRRRAIFTNHAAKSPMISINAALSLMGVPLPKKSTEYRVTKRRNGSLIVRL